MKLKFYLAIGYIVSAFLMSYVRNTLIADRKVLGDKGYELLLSIYALFFGVWVVLTYILIRYYDAMILALAITFAGMAICYFWVKIGKKLLEKE